MVYEVIESQLYKQGNFIYMRNEENQLKNISGEWKFFYQGGINHNRTEQLHTLCMFYLA